MKIFLRGFLLSLAFYSTAVMAKVQVEADTFLWKIEKEGTPISYILGTIHLGEEGAVLTPDIRKLLEQADVLVLESKIKPDERKNGQPDPEVMVLAQKMYDSRPSLPAFLGDKYTKKLDRCQLLQEQEKMAHYLRPWAAAMLCSYAIPKGMNMEAGIDFLLNAEAKRLHKRVLPLETPNEMADYFANIPEKQALTLLKINIDDYIEMQQMTKKLVGQYEQGQFQKVIAEFFEAQAMLKGLSEEDKVFFENWLYQDLLFKRNQKWLPKLVETLKTERTLIGVGAAHLATEKGLIALLRSEGFSVTPVLAD